MNRRSVLQILFGAGGGALLAQRAWAEMAAGSRPYLDAALRAERWLSAAAVRDADGTRWPVVPGSPAAAIERSLYSGSSGVILAYVELFVTTGESRYLDVARDAARWLARDIDTVLSGDEAAGLYTGRTGELWVIAEVARLADDRSLRERARKGAAIVSAAAQRQSRGVKWNDVTDIISGTAGISLGLLALADHLHDERLRELAADGARQLLDRTTMTADRADWPMTESFARRMPNFSHGTAGVSYALATIGQRVGDPTLIEMAQAGARQLHALATPVGSSGRRVFHSTPGNEQLFYLSWCHGPVGTARLFHRLHQIDARAEHARMADALAEGTIASSVPSRSPGFWENVSQCCGNAGVVEHFIDRARILRDPTALAFAQRVMDEALGRAHAERDRLSWPQAENRTQPTNIQAQTGFMQGAAGLMVALLHLDGVAERRAPAVVLPDSPYVA
jgi:lantibiotic modifying enzyme